MLYVLRDSGMSRTTIDRYATEIRRRWQTEHLVRSETVVEERLEHHRKLADKLEKKGAYAAQVRVEKMIDDILGVIAPVEHNVRGAVAHAHAAVPAESILPPEPPVEVEKIRALPDDQLAAVVAAARAVLGQPALLPASEGVEIVEGVLETEFVEDD